MSAQRACFSPCRRARPPCCVFVGANPAFLLAIGDWLSGRHSTRMKGAILALMVLVQLALVRVWVEGGMALD
jgi:hypothetical protein